MRERERKKALSVSKSFRIEMHAAKGIVAVPGEADASGTRCLSRLSCITMKWIRPCRVVQQCTWLHADAAQSLTRTETEKIPGKCGSSSSSIAATAVLITIIIIRLLCTTIRANDENKFPTGARSGCVCVFVWARCCSLNSKHIAATMMSRAGCTRGKSLVKVSAIPI